jgi:hypothetical protein
MLTAAFLFICGSYNLLVFFLFFGMTLISGEPGDLDEINEDDA